ncbi:MAG: DinB family protein [Dehalococcoidales bacterium]|nr:MAG: DinB family protein [Dehalococcoidales bacterium]
MSNSDISSVVYDQCQRALKMFRDAVMAFPADEWKKGEIDYLRPAGVAYHVVETLDFYFGDKPPDKFGWGSRFGVDWEDKDSERLPSQGEIISYLDEMEDKFQQWLKKTDLMAVETLFPWTGALVLGRTMYVARHLQHHVSEMSLELTRRGYQSPEWL